MRLQKYLNEKYFGRMARLEIFVNPSIKEMREIEDDGIRFIADSRSKKVYVWGAMGGIHRDVWEHAIKPNENEERLSKKGVILEGEARQQGSRFVMYESDQLSSFNPDADNMRRKFEWVNRYINIEVPMYWE